MKQTILICTIIILCTLGIICMASVPAMAATPTPTLRPIHPTPTSASIFLRPTPTALSIVPASLPPFTTDAGAFADQVIGMYNYFNSNHLIDFLFSGILIFLVAKYLVRNIAYTTRKD